MPIGSGRVGGFGGIKAAPGKGPHRGLAWRQTRFSQVNPPYSARVFDASVPTYPSGFTEARASSATYFNSSGVLSTATSNTIRIDYDEATLALKGMLIEPAGSELIDFTDTNNAFWGVNAGASKATSANNSPDGTADATTLTLPATAGATLQRGIAGGSITSTVTHTLSMWIRVTSGTGKAYLTLLDETVGRTEVACSLTTNWQRFSVSRVLTSGSPADVLVGQGQFATDASASIEVFGPDVEPGSSATSYIPNASFSVVTRAADAASFTLDPAATQLTFTFDDSSTQTITGLTGGSTYNIPTNLNRPWILYIDASSGVVTVNAALAATEAADTAAFAVTETVNAALAATEAQDTAAIAVSVGDNAALAATEAQDVALINTTESDVAVLAATEAKDTAALAVSVGDNAALATTEAQDVAAINASVGDKAALAATEAQDVALINASESDVAVLAATETQDVAAFVVTEADNATLAATEPSDVAAFTVTVGATIAVLAATENQDVSRLSVAVTEIVIPPDPRASHGLRRIYPAAGVPGVYNADIFGGDTPATTPDFSSGDFSGDFARTGMIATAGSGASIYGAAGALNKPLRRTTGPQMRRTYKYPVQLIPGGIYDKDIYGQNIYQSDS